MILTNPCRFDYINSLQSTLNSKPCQMWCDSQETEWLQKMLWWSFKILANWHFTRIVYNVQQLKLATDFWNGVHLLNLNVVSSFSSPHYLWGSPGLFNLTSFCKTFTIRHVHLSHLKSSSLYAFGLLVNNLSPTWWN